MASESLLTLATLLMSVSDLSWNYALYIPVSNSSWLANMPVMVLNPEETDNPDDDPDEATINGFKYGLMISNVQDVVNNARAQDAHASLEVLIQALKYYYDNDAFLPQ